MKTLWQFLKSRFLWLNLLIALLLGILIAWGALWWLKSYTHHGESVTVPDVKGLYVEEAELLLHDSHLRYEVIDSVYLRSLAPGEIAEQTPAPGTSVKKGRDIYLTVNRRSRKTVQVPMLLGESRRKVQTNLRTLGFNADSVQYKPYEFDDEVLGLLYLDQPIDSGAAIPDGAQIILLVGRSDSTVTRTVPNLLGLTLAEAASLTDAFELVLGLEQYDVPPATPEEKAQYRIYSQTPAAGENVYRGKIINVKLSLTQKTDNPFGDEEDFF